MKPMERVSLIPNLENLDVSGIVEYTSQILGETNNVFNVLPHERQLKIQRHKYYNMSAQPSMLKNATGRPS